MFNFKKKVKNESKVIKNAITVVDKRDEKRALKERKGGEA